MEFKIKPGQIIAILVTIIIIGAFYIGYTTFFGGPQIRIMGIEYSGSGTDYTITVTIANDGSNDVNGAELTVTLYKNNNQVDSEIKQLGTIQHNFVGTQSATLSTIGNNTGASYKVVATITLGDKVLSTHYLTW